MRWRCEPRSSILSSTPLLRIVVIKHILLVEMKTPDAVLRPRLQSKRRHYLFMDLNATATLLQYLILLEL